VLDKPLKNIQAVRSTRQKKLPVVLTGDEVRQLLKQLDGVYWLAACLITDRGCA